MERRSFLTLATKAGGLAVLGIVGGPALLTTFTPVFARREPAWVRVGELEAFALGRIDKAIVEVPRDDRAKSLRRHGVFVLRTHQGAGYGPQAVRLVMARHRGVKRFLANINPANQRSIAVFADLGFRHIQNTYELVR